ncbi:ABC transporter substrate-binding protein [Rhizobium phaseoli]|uniref:ABC transporter substrate-binding protein n=1 Tax=Rhizobium phaseoli TaxID=396 RepID=UPI000202C278|nr:sugar ABC transporter substrate-binding protein [Rhizobium phaseoli]EGE61397.1 extracellular solute-binding protein [Rhizobium etli CNPAF512]PCD64103.1 sugar ABC transporter substrate-binding protein [Rhizobium phaseoli]
MTNTPRFTVPHISRRFLLQSSAIALGAAALPSGLLAQGKTVVTHSNWRSTEMPDIFLKVFDDYRKANPDVDLQVEEIGFIEYIKKMELSGQAGALPDTFELWVPTQLARFVEEDWIAPLDELIEADKAAGNDVLGAYEPWADRGYKGSTYVLPSLGLTNVLLWNRTAFKAAGLPDRAPETIDEMLEFAMKLNKPPELYGLGLDGNGPELWLALAWMFYANETRIGRVGGDFQINKPKAVETVQFIVDLVNKHGVVPSFTTTDFEKLRSSFAAGRVAMMPDWNGVPAVIEGLKPTFEWAISPLPKGKTTGAMLMGGDSTYAISANSKNKKAAWEFIKVLAGHDTQQAIADKWPFLITRKEIWDEVQKGTVGTSDSLKVALEQSQRPNAYDTYSEMPPQLLQAVDIFRTELHGVVANQQTAQEGMDKVAAQWADLYQQWDESYGELGDRYTR